ncbi:MULTISPECIES: formylglycine-generating enzyme family protein [unclassified Pseudoalteromonas]|uniref:SUMF1/EgtB/PvdO family nonheme iron enzyme n=1 Tax=unclassified Pseudoalteromonas TaxID=194690 RepID=UPI00110C1DB6|nr:MULTISPECIES: formylglycine-generating enzyme family protein [unclassified Pseudoalteromonas]MED5512760.1 SUMF1/EgtB/PvdO family nonheme iron enzyme [Pseudomonadota bacterium]MCF2916104.1 SUMF1/EgtB/PvdO family nonheme iron enzyme [Pseudoalteromonas sp. Cn5-37]MCH2087291.1 SUMF1/EgtB/PvdO family nonheme iron enzyme [Pseudoalteromonas sp.]NHH88056.1 Serine/threonine-protein kinase pkn1 [Pseudoalteromonas sp. MB47]TMP47054.1 sulfatase modifying factor 1 [Pseudoalteromonas sp. S1650]
MRIAPLSLLISVSLLATSAFAQDTATVTGIESEISKKQAEYDNSTLILEKHLKEESQLQKQLELLRARSTELDKEKNQALDAMNEMYRRLIDDPTLDISNAQSRYQKAVVDHKQNKDDISMQLAAIASHRKDIEQIRVSKHTQLNTLESLKEQLATARVERLRNEFTREGTLEVNHTINCKRTETLAACEQRGQQMGLQKATKRFVDQIFANLTEERLVEPKRNLAGAQVKILSSHVVNSAFSGQGNYNVNLSVTMRGDVNSSRLCSLLNLDNRFCADYGTPLAGNYQANYDATYSDSQLTFSNSQDNNQVVSVSRFNEQPVSDYSVKKPIKVEPLPDQNKSKMVELTLRSNVYDDEVFIDGVSYGATRLTTSLPKGFHDIEIRKRGYKSYKARIDLRKAQTINANLVKVPEPVVAEVTAAPEQPVTAPVASIVNKTSSASIVVIPAGKFKMGDINGNGLANERPVVEKTIANSFAMQSKEVSVGEYEQFVANTGYKTEAEKDRGCAYYLNGEPVWEATLNWRNPGFDQESDFPAVCLTYNDAKAYADWLSGQTGQLFRLPNEVEWEYAARAGKETEYPWGNEIGKNLANCGWCGSEWSNRSAAPTGSFSPNAFGLYDTVGNVWEWTNKKSGQSDVAVRGGAWNFAPSLARVSTRLILAPDFRANYIGFRLVRER